MCLAELYGVAVLFKGRHLNTVGGGGSQGGSFATVGVCAGGDVAVVAHPFELLVDRTNDQSAKTRASPSIRRFLLETTLRNEQQGLEVLES